MRIAVSGASGFVGSHLLAELKRRGHDASPGSLVTKLYVLSRRPSGGANEIAWNPNEPPQGLNGFDAVIHLAGESIMGRWTPEKKAHIRNSRVTGTRNLAGAIAAAQPRPRTFITASAIGYYGPQGDKPLTEDDPPGSDFLAQVARDWEAAAEPARQAGVRVVNLRIGVVLSPEGGALRQMLTPFRLGAGGRVGSGKQWMSWVALDDVIGAILFALDNQTISGPVNVVAPNPVTNADFTKALGEALHRPTLWPMPEFAVKLAFGEMGESLLLGSQRVVAAKLQASGYKFRHRDIGEALSAMLKKA